VCEGTTCLFPRLLSVLPIEPTCKPALNGAVWHGLRANAVIRLRQEGYSALQISDMVGMSTSVVERYCRHADRKAGGQAMLLALKERRSHKTVKP